MKLTDLKKLAPRMYETRKSILLQGKPGCGKTDTVRELPSVLEAATGEEFGIVEYFLTTRESVDVAGFMVPSKEEIDGKVTPVATYTLPDIIRRVRATGLEHGVLFLDEFSQAQHDMQKAVANLILDREVNGFKIPDGWWIVAASNRTEDKAGVNRLLSHVTNRFRVIDIETSIDEWAIWAQEHELHPMAIAFARFRPGSVQVDAVPTKPGPFPTLRSYTAATEFLMTGVDSVDDPIITDALTVESISGDIGEACAAEMVSFLKTHEFLPTADEILNDPKKAKIPPQERLDAAYAAVMLAVNTATKNKGDMNAVDQCFTYCTRLQLELQTMAARDMVRAAGGAALNAPSIAKFTTEHKGLVLNSI